MSHPFDLTGKVALITGANAGIGLGFAEAIAAAKTATDQVAPILLRRLVKIPSIYGPELGRITAARPETTSRGTPRCERAAFDGYRPIGEYPRTLPGPE